MGRLVSFQVPGRPQRWQRPKNVVRRGQVFTVNEKAHDANKLAIAQLARLAWKGPPVSGPVSIKVDAIFDIPSSWPAMTQRAAAQGRVFHIQDPDYDQIVKLVMDALTGIVYLDDNQVVGFPQGCKRYGGPERTEVVIHVIDQQPDEITPGQRSVHKKAVERGLVPKPCAPRANSLQLFPSNAETNRGSK